LKKKLGGLTCRFFLLDRSQYIVYRGAIIHKEEALTERVERYPKIQPVVKVKKPADRLPGDTRGRKKRPVDPRKGNRLDVEA